MLSRCLPSEWPEISILHLLRCTDAGGEERQRKRAAGAHTDIQSMERTEEMPWCRWKSSCNASRHCSAAFGKPRGGGLLKTTGSYICGTRVGKRRFLHRSLCQHSTQPTGWLVRCSPRVLLKRHACKVSPLPPVPPDGFLAPLGVAVAKRGRNVSRGQHWKCHLWPDEWPGLAGMPSALQPTLPAFVTVEPTPATPPGCDPTHTAGALCTIWPRAFLGLGCN